MLSVHGPVIFCSKIFARWRSNNEQSPGRALDLACGAGRNSVFLSSIMGSPLKVIDISAAAIARGAAFATQVGVQVGWVCQELACPE